MIGNYSHKFLLWDILPIKKGQNIFFCVIFGKKTTTMTTAELKINIFRQIDMLDQKRLEKVYLMINKITDNNSDWDNLTEQQQQGLLNAIEEAETGYLVPHNEVMDKARKKITNATHD